MTETETFIKEKNEKKRKVAKRLNIIGSITLFAMFRRNSLNLQTELEPYRKSIEKELRRRILSKVFQINTDNYIKFDEDIEFEFDFDFEERLKEFLQFTYSYCKDANNLSYIFKNLESGCYKKYEDDVSSFMYGEIFRLIDDALLEFDVACMGNVEFYLEHDGWLKWMKEPVATSKEERKLHLKINS